MTERSSAFSFRRLLIVLGFVYLSILLLLRIFESHLIFFPDFPSRLAGDWHPSGLPVEDVWVSANDGTKLHAWWIPADGAKFTFLAFYGNAGNISDRVYVHRFLHELPVNASRWNIAVMAKAKASQTKNTFIAMPNRHCATWRRSAASLPNPSFRMASRSEPPSQPISHRKRKSVASFSKRPSLRSVPWQDVYIGFCQDSVF